MLAQTKYKKELLDLASDFGTFVGKHKWISRYDAESDAFYSTVPTLSQDARIRYFDNEVAFYITKDNKIEGIFMEYFGSNFVKHHKDLKNIFKDITKNAKKETRIKLEFESIKKLAPDLEEAIKLSLAERLNLAI